MRATRIEVEGREGRAVLRREPGEVVAQVITHRGVREVRAPAGHDAKPRGGAAQQRWDMARAVQGLLDGFRSTNTDINEYRGIIEMLAD